VPLCGVPETPPFLIKIIDSIISAREPSLVFTSSPVCEAKLLQNPRVSRRMCVAFCFRLFS
jgi:hypothetical protein